MISGFSAYGMAICQRLEGWFFIQFLRALSLWISLWASVGKSPQTGMGYGLKRL
jgi:hypothetical protein